MVQPEVIEDLFPASAQARVFVTHTRPAPFIGTVWPLLKDPVLSPVLGYINHGGTLDEKGMLFANGCTWAHILTAAATGLGEQPDIWLNENELGALMGRTEPFAIFDPVLRHVE
jgi:hypothetical protein